MNCFLFLLWKIQLLHNFNGVNCTRNYKFLHFYECLKCELFDFLNYVTFLPWKILMFNESSGVNYTSLRLFVKFLRDFKLWIDLWDYLNYFAFLSMKHLAFWQVICFKPHSNTAISNIFLSFLFVNGLMRLLELIFCTYAMKNAALKQILLCKLYPTLQVSTILWVFDLCTDYLTFWIILLLSPWKILLFN